MTEAQMQDEAARSMMQGHKVALILGDVLKKLGGDVMRPDIIVNALAFLMAQMLVNTDGEVSIHEYQTMTVLSDDERLAIHTGTVKLIAEEMRLNRQQELSRG